MVDFIHLQQWQRNEDFLKRKKHEEEKNGDTYLTKPAKCSPIIRNNSRSVNHMRTNHMEVNPNFNIQNFPDPAIKRNFSRFQERYPPIWFGQPN